MIGRANLVKYAEWVGGIAQRGNDLRRGNGWILRKEVVGNPKPLPEQITASIEDVQALLDSNRNLSVAFLSRRLKDLETEMRERFRGLNQDPRINSLEEAVKTLKEKLNVAAVKFREMRDDVDKVKK